jgi:hypothetical protein
LGHGSGWKAVNSRLDVASNHLTLWLDFETGSHFPCSECGELCPVRDTVEKKWRYPGFWQQQTTLVTGATRIIRADFERNRCHGNMIIHNGGDWQTKPARMRAASFGLIEIGGQPT